MSNYTKKELSDLTLGKLKEVAKEYGITGLTKYKADDKPALVTLILSAIRKAKKATTPTSVPQMVPTTLKTGLSCDMDEATCVTSSKYKKDNIVQLATQCGLSAAEINGKTRRELCKLIAVKMSGTIPPPRAQSPPRATSPPRAQSPPRVYTIAELTKITNNNLKEICKKVKADCKSSDTKPILVKKIMKATTPRGVSPQPSPRVVSPQPSPRVVSSSTCIKKLLGKNIKDLKALLTKSGTTSGQPKNKPELVDYLCALEENGRCDPEKGEDCDDGFVCDGTAKICLSPEQAEKRNLTEMIWNGRKIIGTPFAIENLKKKLNFMEPKLPQTPTMPRPPKPLPPMPRPPKPLTPIPSPESSPMPSPMPSSDESSPMPSPMPSPIRRPIQPPPPQARPIQPPPPPQARPIQPPPPQARPIQPPPPQDPFAKPGEDTVINEDDDIEEILRELSKGDGRDISELAATQKMVVKCLGLLG